MDYLPTNKGPMMIKLNATLAVFFLGVAVVSQTPAFASEGSSTKDAEEQYLYHPKHQQTNFDTDVTPLHPGSLQGFDCMDQNGDGYLTIKELSRRNDCVEDASDRGLESSTRTTLILDHLDADRDLKVSKREFSIWNEMQKQ
ncbi:hypothetical protein [Marinobacter sp. AN1]|uniref:hypothetical protein n=1 Tax=Marinobacter sp. AN1 TaxID=2886046 RepID=UPI0022323EED|nr:hypothetical protein [Marinobacter sp. AN1]UZD67312.1 hypothetical protein LJ360_08365 [Marinobacter sp. AN1]